LQDILVDTQRFKFIHLFRFSVLLGALAKPTARKHPQ
jgi:hypothetical protein